jgi:hypothetical protein
MKLAQAKFLGGLATILVGGIMLFNQGSEDEGDEGE